MAGERFRYLVVAFLHAEVPDRPAAARHLDVASHGGQQLFVSTVPHDRVVMAVGLDEQFSGRGRRLPADAGEELRHGPDRAGEFGGPRVLGQQVPGGGPLLHQPRREQDGLFRSWLPRRMRWMLTDLFSVSVVSGRFLPHLVDTG
ncbi:hypothetical protein ACFQ36_19505 [Arthrobacter sp. GCM10027362]|uniref:hypothetical protein n=1 Tax=Arthrobacter sp. GCM10027362 TaxID=3273379 RepID=UPI00362E2669